MLFVQFAGYQATEGAQMLIKTICVGALLSVSSAAAVAAVPRASCRKGDKPESGLQGETTQAEVDSGANKLGFNCNTDLVGQNQGEGANWQLAAWKNCAYYDQAIYLQSQMQHPGTVVLDVSDPSNPQVTDYLTTPAMLDPWESLKVNAKRQLLAGDQGTYPNSGPGFAIYDISADCRHPVLKSSVNLPGSFGHTGQWAPDGNTYYITPLRPTPSIIPVDTTDTSNPKEILLWTAPSPYNPILHDLEFSKDGNTASVSMIGGGTRGANGLLVLDVSDVQSRKSNPDIRVLGSVIWDDGSTTAQNALPVTIAGKPYIVFTDEGGLGAAGCSAGKSAHGFPRFIDVSDPKNPTVVSKLMLDVQDPANCSKSVSGIGGTPRGPPNYSCPYCNVNDADNATLMACSCFNAGLRIFDIHDPLSPKEIAYYKPRARGTQVLPGSEYFSFILSGNTSFDQIGRAHV